MSCHAPTDAFAFETITVAATAIGPTEATRAGDASISAAQAAYITVETASIRLRYDGTDPTATVGHLVQAGETLRLEGSGNIAALKMIRSGTTSAAVSVTYER